MPMSERNIMLVLNITAIAVALMVGNFMGRWLEMTVVLTLIIVAAAATLNCMWMNSRDLKKVEARRSNPLT